MERRRSRIRPRRRPHVWPYDEDFFGFTCTDVAKFLLPLDVVLTTTSSPTFSPDMLEPELELD